MTSRQERIENMVTYLHHAQCAIRETEKQLSREKSRAADLEQNLAEALIPPALKHNEKLTVLVGDRFFEVWLEAQDLWPACSETDLGKAQSMAALKPTVTYKPRVRTLP